MATMTWAGAEVMAPRVSRADPTHARIRLPCLPLPPAATHSDNDGHAHALPTYARTHAHKDKHLGRPLRTSPIPRQSVLFSQTRPSPPYNHPVGVCLPSDINSCPRHAPPSATGRPPPLPRRLHSPSRRIRFKEGPRRGSLALGPGPAASWGHAAAAPATDAPRTHAHTREYIRTYTYI